LTDAFSMTYTMLIDSWGLYSLACTKCDSDGLTVKGSKGSDVKSPWTRIRAEMLDEVTRLASCFGLTPADIARVRAIDTRTLDETKSKFFARGEGA